MIPSGANVYVATRPVDFREGPDGLAALVRDTGADPFSGALYVFRAKRADRVKIVWWDGSGLCLFVRRPARYRLCRLHGAGRDRRQHYGEQSVLGPPNQSLLYADRFCCAGRH